MNYILQPYFKTIHSCIVITLNPESNCTCPEKNHFLFRWCTLTLPEQHLHLWTYCWTQQPSLSQVNTIGCADEGLWIFSLEDSKKRRYTVNWEDQSCSNQTGEHELMIDSGCFGHVCPPWFAPQFPMVSSTNVDAVAANNVVLQHLRTKSGVRTRYDEQR